MFLAGSILSSHHMNTAELEPPLHSDLAFLSVCSSHGIGPDLPEKSNLLEHIYYVCSVELGR